MSNALYLSSRPNLEHYKKLAKELLRAPAGVGSEPIEQLWQRHKKPDPCKLADVQFFLARAHGFASWPKFAKHVEALERANSPVSQFEAAADAIVGGDLPALRQLLRENPDLVRARSTRSHRSTLLHYVSANGVEDYRQRTPPQIVEITRFLLDAGADVNAESDAYGGHSTALNLTATSGHPEEAGLQIPLLELLLERGALIDGPDGSSTVNACLRNGRGQAAEWLASRGASLDLEGASGVGRLDLVAQLVNGASIEDAANGLAWACEYGRLEVVDFLLQQGVSVTPPDARPTGLHWAAHTGRADLVKLLLAHGAPAQVIESRFQGTPLEWALHGWSESSGESEGWYEVVALLIQAGVEPHPNWAENAKVKADPRMLAALRGEWNQ